MNNIIDEINKDLKNIDYRLSITYDNEDLHGQDFEEYGIEDINDTKHFALLLENEGGHSATVIKEHFAFNVPRSLRFGSSDMSYLESIEFTRENIQAIEKVLLSYSK